MRIQLNLMPQAVLTRRGRSTRRRVLIGVPLLAVGVLALLYLLLVMQEAQARQAARDEEILLVPLRPVAVQLAQLQTEIDEFKKRQGEFQTVVREHRMWSGLLEDISRLIPQDAWLHSVKLDGNTLTASGGALSLRAAAQFAENLTLSPNVITVQLKSLQETAAQGQRAAVFELNAMLKGAGR